MLPFLIAAQLSAPVPVGEPWFKSQDFPRALIQQRRPAAVTVMLTTSINGRIISCSIEQTSGIPAIDQYTCELARKRGRFLPARGADGLPSYGGYRLPINWSLSPSSQAKLPPEISLTVKRLPLGVKSPTYVGIAFSVAADGSVSSCGAARPVNRADLIQVACNSAMRGFQPRPILNEAGQRVPSVQNARVELVAE